MCGRGSCVSEAQCHTHATASCVEREERDGGALLLGQTHAYAASEYGGPMQRVSMVALCHRESSDLGW
jgi:hypothetical protein